MQDFAENILVFNTSLSRPATALARHEPCRFRQTAPCPSSVILTVFLSPVTAGTATTAMRLRKLRCLIHIAEEESCSNSHDCLPMLSHVHQQRTLKVVECRGIQL